MVLLLNALWKLQLNSNLECENRLQGAGFIRYLESLYWLALLLYVKFIIGRFLLSQGQKHFDR